MWDRPVCCNGCDGDIDLRDEGGNDDVFVLTDELICHDDESAVCCSRDVDDVVIVQGRVSSYDPDNPPSRPGLLDATVCRVER